jgi:hypothetical protein
LIDRTAPCLENAIGTGTDSVPGRAINNIAGNDWRGGCRDFKGERLAPQERAVLWIDGNQSALSEENYLTLTQEGGHDGCGVGHFVVLPFPHGLAGLLVNAEQSLSFAAASHKNQAVLNDRGGGILPSQLGRAVVCRQVALPDQLTGGGLERRQLESGVEHVDFVATHRRGRAWSIAALVGVGARVAALRHILQEPGVGSRVRVGTGIQGDEGLAFHAFGVATDQGKGAILGDGDELNPPAVGDFQT